MRDADSTIHQCSGQRKAVTYHERVSEWDCWVLGCKPQCERYSKHPNNTCTFQNLGHHNHNAQSVMMEAGMFGTHTGSYKGLGTWDIGDNVFQEKRKHGNIYKRERRLTCLRLHSTYSPSGNIHPVLGPLDMKCCEST